MLTAFEQSPRLVLPEYVSAAEFSGSEFLLRVLGESGVRELFGFTQDEVAAIRLTPRADLFARTLSDADVEKKFKGSMWRIYDLRREYARLADARVNRELLQNELAEGLGNAWTAFTEYAWGKNTKFYYKLVRHPVSNESKLVMYDPNIHIQESWEAAWKREDMRISNARFISVKSERDALYADNFDGLRERDLLEGELMDFLVSHGSHVFSDRSAATIMSVSPSPSPSKYAREMGYGATHFKKLSHWRIYSFEKIDEQAIAIDATTIFTYRPIRRLRQVMLEEVVGSTGTGAEQVKSLNSFPRHTDLLRVPFSPRTASIDAEAVVDRIDHALNDDRFISDYLSVFSYFATKWHREHRMTDKKAAEEIFAALVKKFQWRYYCILAEGNLARDEMLLKELMVLMMEEGAQMYATHMTDSVEQSRGKSLSKRERAKLERLFVYSVQERSLGGLCPAASLGESVTRTSNREGNTTDLEQGHEIVCGNCRREFTQEQILVLYHVRSGKENAVCPFCRCDVCGVKHGNDWVKNRRLVSSSIDTFEEHTRLGLIREVQVETASFRLISHLKTVPLQEDSVARRFMSSGRFNRVVVDFEEGELVVLDFGLVPLRRKLNRTELLAFSQS